MIMGGEHGNNHLNNGVSGPRCSIPSGPPPVDVVRFPPPAGNNIPTYDEIQ